MTQALEGLSINSAIYEGHIRHRRFEPVNHDFTYPIFMMWLNLDELPSLMSKKWFFGESWYHLIRFKRADFFNPEVPNLKRAIIENVNVQFHKQGLDQPRIHSVVLLTHLRYFNLIFNPVSFYYCFDENNALVAIQAEITNTPWKERHSYVLPVSDQADDSKAMRYKALKGAALSSNESKKKHEFCFQKQFHVSPFNPMDMQYRWVFDDPQTSLLVHMDNTAQSLTTSDDGQSHITKHFDATLMMQRSSFSKRALKVLIRYPLLTVKVVVGIYWQALKLFIKRSPFYSHPECETK